MNLPKRNSGKDVKEKRGTRLVSTAYSGFATTDRTNWKRRDKGGDLVLFNVYDW